MPREEIVMGRVWKPFAALTIVMAASGFLGMTAAAQEFPSRPVRVLVGFTAGAGPDVLARAVSAQLSVAFGQQFIVENQAGANGTLAIGTVARAEPNGYTLLFSSASITPVPFMSKNLRFDILRDLAPVASVGGLDGLFMLVHPATPVRNVAEFIAYAKANRVVYGSPGVGNTLHLATEMFKLKAGVDMDHVPFRGAGDVANALLSRSIHLMLVTPPSVLGLVSEGQLRPIGFTGSKPFPEQPGLDLVKDVVPGYPVWGSWGMYFAPAATPVEIVERLNGAIRKAIEAPGVAKVTQGAGYYPDGRDAAATAAFFRAEVEAARVAVEAAGIKPN